jgi:hypothetical protein
MTAETVVITAPDTVHLPLTAGPLRAEITHGRLRLTCGGVEVIRQIDCPIRDPDWRTLPVEETTTQSRQNDTGFSYLRVFRTLDGSIAGRLTIDAQSTPDGAHLTARLTLAVEHPTEVNRAGFILLHPIAGVAGTPLDVRHPDNTLKATHFPTLISPAQPVLDIAGLRHAIHDVDVSIAFEGDVFEMEDQRNWTDASFKTYCRPLALPRPYRLAAGAIVEQAVHVTLRPTPSSVARPAASPASLATLPRITLAHDATLADPPPPAALARLALDGLLLRLDARAPDVAPPLDLPLTLEIITDSPPDLTAVAAACRAAGVAPRRVVALPRGYLASHQPEGPWPAGPTPTDLLPLVRATFPGAAAGGGMLTNFTEFNRAAPDPHAIDFATFGTTAIVHAADDRSVLETLEALPHVFASARALVPGRDLHLGLVAIGMRSNPYGAAVAPNPDRQRIPMAMDDPRQRTGFAAAWAVAAAAAAARGGIASYAPAMTSGPLGLGTDADLWPLFEVVAALAALGGSPVEATGGPSSGLIRLLGRGRRGIAGLAANLGPDPVEIAPPDGATLTLVDGTHATATTTLPPFGVAIFRTAA